MSKKSSAAWLLASALLWLVASPATAQQIVQQNVPGRPTAPGILPLGGSSEVELVMQQYATPVIAPVTAIQPVDDDRDDDRDSVIRPVSALRSAASGCGGCGHSCCNTSCCRCQCCPHRTGVFGEFLVWQVTDADVPFAQLQNSGGIASGQVGVADPSFEPGFRVGGLLNLDCRSSIGVTYTWFESTTNASLVSGDEVNVVTPLITYPGTTTGNAYSSTANYDIRLHMGDIEYRSLWRYGNRYAINWLAGVRLTHLDQDLAVTTPFLASAQGTTNNITNIDFDGAGIRFGLEAERQIHPDHAFRVYSKASCSLLTGEFEATYLQQSVSGTQATTSWSDDRIVPILDCELGINWTNSSGNLRFAAGWTVQAWFNTLSTNDWVSSVQTVNFTDASDTLTFSGVTARIEFLLP